MGIRTGTTFEDGKGNAPVLLPFIWSVSVEVTIKFIERDEFLTIDLWKSKKYPDRFFKKNLKTLEEANNVPTRYISRKSYVMI